MIIQYFLRRVVYGMQIPIFDKETNYLIEYKLLKIPSSNDDAFYIPTNILMLSGSIEILWILIGGNFSQKIFLNYYPVSWGGRIDQQLLCREGLTPHQLVSYIWH